ncbi:MAG TPA: hypothetical protein VHJ78_12140 [Actinomycetota bacterium]|nr:hypothetical protein [Actinomycetota bacterium]
MSGLDHEERLDEARLLLENVALLETVAAEREARAEELMASLEAEGLAVSEIAKRMDISEGSAAALLSNGEPMPAHDRMGISEETMDKLAPLRVPPSVTGSAS